MSKTISNSSTVSRVVCWKCKKGGQKGDSPLKKISDTDYVCMNDIQWGKPDIGNQSKIYFTKDEKGDPAHDKRT